jgi:AbrB family looped-hinge helix DNA binding protein
MHSTVTKKGQTTIPGPVRDALKIRPGDKLEYKIEGDKATIRVHPGLMSLKGIFKREKGQEMTMDEIRRGAAENDQERLEREYGPRAKRGKLLICHFDRRKAK